MLVEKPVLLQRQWKVKKIVNKGIDSESHRLMYQVKWQREREKTWEFFHDLIKDGCFIPIEQYEVHHFTNEAALQSKDKRCKGKEKI